MREHYPSIFGRTFRHRRYSVDSVSDLAENIGNLMPTNALFLPGAVHNGHAHIELPEARFRFPPEYYSAKINLNFPEDEKVPEFVKTVANKFGEDVIKKMSAEKGIIYDERRKDNFLEVSLQGLHPLMKLPLIEGLEMFDLEFFYVPSESHLLLTDYNLDKRTKKKMPVKKEEKVNLSVGALAPAFG